MNKLNLLSHFQSLCSNMHGSGTPRAGTPCGTVLSAADVSRSDCSFSITDQNHLCANALDPASETSLFTPRSSSVGNIRQTNAITQDDLTILRSEGLSQRPRMARYVEKTTVRSVSRSKEDGSLPIIQKVLTPVQSHTKSQVQTAQSQEKKRKVLPSPIPNLPTCSTSYSKKCWTEWRTTPGPGEYAVQSYKAVGTDGPAHNFGEVYVNGVAIKRTSDAVHEHLEKERRRPDFYSYSTVKPYDSPCYLINPLGVRKENGNVPGRDPKLTLRDVRCHESVRLRDIMRKRAISTLGVTF